MHKTFWKGLSRPELDEESRSESFLLESLPSALTTVPARTLVINQPPIFMGGSLSTQYLTFGYGIRMVLPVFFDYEGDYTSISFTNDLSPNLNIYAEQVSTVEDAYIYKMQSEELVEGYNAELGTINIVVTWTDMNTKEYEQRDVEVIVLPYQDYHIKVEQGLIQDSATETFLDTIDALKQAI